MPGIEPGAFHMQSERSTAELHPHLMTRPAWTNEIRPYIYNVILFRRAFLLFTMRFLIDCVLREKNNFMAYYEFNNAMLKNEPYTIGLLISH